MDARINTIQRQNNNRITAKKLLGIKSHENLLTLVYKGLPFSSFIRFQRTMRLTAGTLSSLLGVPPRTLARRKLKNRLEPSESDNLVRVARVYAHAAEFYNGNTKIAAAWMDSPHPGVNNLRPCDLVTTDIGAREVEALLQRLEKGIPY